MSSKWHNHNINNKSVFFILMISLKSFIYNYFNKYLNIYIYTYT